MTEHHAIPEPPETPDHPPQSASLEGLSDDVLSLLSAYLDGELSSDPAGLSRIETLMDNDPGVKAAFLKLQQLRHQVGRASQKAYEDTSLTPEMPDCWNAIASQLEADEAFRKELEPLALNGQTASSEFLCAYYDGELPRTSPGVQAFEAQLSQDETAGKTLSQWLSLSKLMKASTQRLEDSCTVDVTSGVMAKISEQGLMQEMPEDIAELISAYFDGDGISEKDKARAAALLETRADCRQFALFYRRLRDGISQNVETLESQVPEADWFRIELAIEQSLAKREKGRLLPFIRSGDQPQNRPGGSKKWIATGAIAASFFLVAIAGFKFISGDPIPALSQTQTLAEKPAQQRQLLASGHPHTHAATAKSDNGAVDSSQSQLASSEAALSEKNDPQSTTGTDFLSATLARLAGAASAIQPNPVGPDDASDAAQSSEKAKTDMNARPAASIVIASATPGSQAQAHDGSNWPRTAFNPYSQGNQYVVFNNGGQNPFAFLPNQYIPAAPSFVFRARQPFDAVNSPQHGTGKHGEITFVSNSQGAQSGVSARAGGSGQIIGGSRLFPDDASKTQDEVQENSPQGETVAVKITPLQSNNSQLPSSEAYLIELMQDEHLPDQDVDVLYDL